MDATVTGLDGQSGADGSNGGAGFDGSPGASAQAIANSTTDTTNTATATGGRGGNGGIGSDAPPGAAVGGGRGGNGSYAGDATASAVTTASASGTTSAYAVANGGIGGDGAQGGFPTGLGGVGDHGGSAEDTSAVDVNMAGAAYATATDAGGAGGGPSYDHGQSDASGNYTGTIYVGSAGGSVANTTASATGTTQASARVVQAGGAGGDGEMGGVGAASSLINAVTGSTAGGALSLNQMAQGGAGGAGDASIGGAAGAANSDLTFDDTASPTQSAMLQTGSIAFGGAGGMGEMGGTDGADASASSTITGAQDLNVTSQASGGDGGASGAFIAGNAGGPAANGGNATATASAVSTSATGQVENTVVADGGYGGAAEDGAYVLAVPSNGGNGGQATVGPVSATGGASADVEATANGGNGGTSDGAIGGTGADATLVNTVTGSTHRGSLTLDETAGAGSGGDSFGGTGGQGGNATAGLTFDDTANANQSATLAVNIEAGGGLGGFDQIGANPGLDPVGTSRQLSGDGGSAVANGSVTAAPVLPSGTPTTLDLTVMATSGFGLDGGDATANATGTGGTANVQSYATASGGLEQSDAALDRAGTATANATATDAGGFVIAQAASNLDSEVGSALSSVSGSAFATVFGTSTAHSIAGFNQQASFATTGQAVADVIGLPSAPMTGTDVGPGETLLFDAEQGSSAPPGATGSETTTTTIDTMINLTPFEKSSEFLLDLHQASVVGTGVTGVTFDLTGLATGPIHQVFTDAASAATYFTNDVIDLGSFNTVTGGSSTLYVQMKLAVTTDDAASGFYAEMQGAGTACYCPGTRVRTPGGPVAIEDLRIGDPVVTLHGPAQPIKWIGRRSYDGRFLAGQVLMLPVCITRDAIAPGVPARDLHVSPGHALYVDGVLVPAWLLVNGTSITQAVAVDHVTYLHLEFAAHEVIFAEDCPAESFVDDACRNQFENAAEYHALYPDEPAEPPPLCAARVEDGFVLQAIQQRLAARAGVELPVAAHGKLRGFVDQAGPAVVTGWAQDLTQPDVPVCLDVLVGGRRMARALANHYRADLRRAGMGSGKHGFEVRLPAGAAEAVEVRRSLDGALLTFTEAATERRLVA